MNIADKNIVDGQSIAWQNLGAGVSRQVLFYDQNQMMVKFAFEQGAVGKLHSHPHLQISYVLSGKYVFELDGQKRIIVAGDVYNVPSGVEHGIVCLEAGELVDVFNPVREDFL
jgi:quercetin dioxygenase-like cupin family protein